MTNELITSENFSVEQLKTIFDDAYMDISVGEKGEIMVHDDVDCLVLINEQRKDLVRLMALFGFEPTVSEVDRLRTANRINDEYIVVRAIAGLNDTLQFDWHIPVSGGISKKSLVLTVKRFCSIPLVAIQDHAEDLVK